MTLGQIKSIFKDIGITITEGKEMRLPKLNTIIMSQNFIVVPERDMFTFDGDLIKIKQKSEYKKDGEIVFHETSANPYDFVFDISNIIGFEFLSVRSRY